MSWRRDLYDASSSRWLSNFPLVTSNFVLSYTIRVRLLELPMQFDPLSGIYLTNNKKDMAVIVIPKYKDVQSSVAGRIITWYNEH